MIRKLLSLGRKRSDATAAVPCVPEGRRIYAIGDIHGRFDLLERLLARIDADDSARGGSPGELIFLGDLVDRGPDSAKVVDRLIALRDERPGTRFLLGNHEEVFLSALQGDAKGLRFLTRIGGIETILSYGIVQETYAAADYDELARLVEAAVPAAHRQFLESFEDQIVAGDYVFVHAGIRPGVALDEQRPSDLRWIREEFLGAEPPFAKVVVHGHTIFDEVVELPHRIALDTGAFRSGVLSAMGFEGDRRWIVQERGLAAAVAA
ncbi:serine/threonine protein phosphatase [Novosphingobium sp. G106]|uniref:metallophosphoesterase family protein n=1 Tax=Novosphingobium sp. G106 TaxID=2849500 RepID=UPI001C2D49C9|nr:metallophosphoesterase family protein [Novosphingobium sp. G106]MBV1689791.1 serine/threonine protein phosphatase [Novosphingobium sp. G106]